MDKSIVIGLVLRHALTAIGGWMVGQGYISDGDVELGVGAILTLVGIVWSIVEKHQRKISGIAPTAILLILFLVSCAGVTPRQQFYMSEVAFSGAQSAAIAYLSTPYGKEAPKSVLTAISETSDEGTATLYRLRPLVPNKGQEIPDLNRKLLSAGLNTLDSVIERLNRTVFDVKMYEEE